MKFHRWFGLFAFTLVAGCGGTDPAPDAPLTAEQKGAEKAVFSDPTLAAPGEAKVRKLANSDYPSWQVFDVAARLGFIDKTAGKLGPLEKKYNVDLVLVRGDYTDTINMYGSGAVDAVTITNTDILAPSISRESVAIFPTSTSQGADACVCLGYDEYASGVKTTDATSLIAGFLKGKKIRGAEKSVSEYAFRRKAGLVGLTDKDYEFVNMDPSAAATAIIQGQAGIDVVMVWEPGVEEILNKKPGSKILFDSKSLPMEIIDMVVISKEAYESQGGKAFAACLAETFYNTCLVIAKDDESLTALGEEFAHLDAAQMKVIVNIPEPTKSKCRIFDTPDLGIATFKDAKFPDSLHMIAQFSKEREIIKTEPNVKYAGKPMQAGSGPVNLTFDTSIMEAVQKNK